MSVRVLVVDDEPRICVLLEQVLAPLGYRVDVAFDAISALRKLDTAPTTLALVDVQLPGDDGIWLIEQMQKRHPNTAIIIVTGVQDLDPRITLRPGVAAYLTKPFDPNDLRDLVKSIVSASRLLPPRRHLRLVPRPATIGGENQ